MASAHHTNLVTGAFAWTTGPAKTRAHAVLADGRFAMRGDVYFDALAARCALH